jgi:predicted HNH restriction endonuclease
MQCACGCQTEIEPKDKWGRPRKFVSGHNGRRYTDPTQHKREWNHRNREARYIYKKKYLKGLKEKVIAIMGGKCLDCGVPFNGKNAKIFDLHHLEPDKKDFSIGQMIGNYAWSKILEEISKCVMICANCHRLRHSTEDEDND